MAYLTASIPNMECYLRQEFMFNQESGHGQVIPVKVFGLTSKPSRALMFHVITNTGARFSEVPLHMLCHKANAEVPRLSDIELWDCFSHYFSVVQLKAVLDCTGLVRLGDGVWCQGEYLFEVDWCGGDAEVDLSLADVPHEHKTANVMKLTDGNFAAMPNNRIYWREGSFITNPLQPQHFPKFKTNRQIWTVEGTWNTEDSYRYFYETTKDNSDGE